MQTPKITTISVAGVKKDAILLGLTALSFAVPFSLGNSQLPTGIFVNAALFASAIIQPKKNFPADNFTAQLGSPFQRIDLRPFHLLFAADDAFYLDWKLSAGYRLPKSIFFY